MRKVKIVLLILLVVFVLIQFIRPAKNQSTNQELTADITGIYTIPNDVQTILKNACYDCHSNNTQYPWYVNIQPIGWFMAGHIKNGKKELNFNEYGTYSSKRQHNKLKRMKEQIEENKMPLSSYTLIHREAKLTANQKEQVTKWIDSTLNAAETGSTN
ncbi:heme-binding domain-containing protein [Chitinophaga sp. 212800010-3]|uniref:heme-binding domain-containing protein n=1 Tax=unclassified Chitinophaga TaxID=2619133 RepID=UPI002DEF3DF9|nr:hem-bd domain-containing protein [Chitinophaga sp. 212800010-3]